MSSYQEQVTSQHPLVDISNTVAAASESTLRVTVESASLGTQRLNKDSMERMHPVCALRVPNRLLITWNKIITAASGQSTSFISLLNENIADRVVCVDPSCDRLENRLRIKSSSLKSHASKLRGRANQSLLSGSSVFVVNEGETLSALSLLKEKELLQEDVERWKGEMLTASAEIEQLQRDISTCEQTPADSFKHKGGKMQNVGKRQKRRLLTKFTSVTNQALWFAESFGLVPQALTVRVPHQSESETQTITLQLNNQDEALNTPTTSTDSNTDHLHQTLYLLEKFGVSDEFYHELSMAYPTLARSFKVKELRSALHSSVDIIRVANPYEGAYRPFKDTLSQAILNEVTL